MVFALPPGMAQALELVHRGSTFRVLGGSRQRASRWTPEYVKLLLSPRHSRGITLVYSTGEQGMVSLGGKRTMHAYQQKEIGDRQRGFGVPFFGRPGFRLLHLSMPRRVSRRAPSFASRWTVLRDISGSMSSYSTSLPHTRWSTAGT